MSNSLKCAVVAILLILCGLPSVPEASAACGIVCVPIGDVYLESSGTTYHCCYVSGGAASSYWLVPPAGSAGAACEGRYTPEVPCADFFKHYDVYGCILLGEYEGNYQQCELTTNTHTWWRAFGSCAIDEHGNPYCNPVDDPNDEGTTEYMRECSICG